MNVVTANKNKEIIDRLDIDIIKRIDGQYELRELLSKFVNLYFNKMIIDITSIENYQDIEIIKQLGKAIDPSRVIILLNDEPELNSPLYMSTLVSTGFYNFTRNFEGIKYLYNNPNNLDSVKHLLLDQSAVKDIIARQEAEAKEREEALQNAGKRIVVGLSNLTDHAGATSLANMMVRQLNAQGNKALGIEMFRQDMLFYHDRNLISCMNKFDLESELKKHTEENAVIIDLNEFGEAKLFCDHILYLVEPSNVKLTKLLKKNRNAFLEKDGEKIVLNQSFVNDQEIADFEYEAKCKVYDNIPPLNDRDMNLAEVNSLLQRLGFILRSE